MEAGSGGEGKWATLQSDERDGGRSAKETERDGEEDDVKHVLGRSLSRPESIRLQSVL